MQTPPRRPTIEEPRAPKKARIVRVDDLLEENDYLRGVVEEYENMIQRYREANQELAQRLVMQRSEATHFRLLSQANANAAAAYRLRLAQYQPEVIDLTAETDDEGDFYEDPNPQELMDF